MIIADVAHSAVERGRLSTLNTAAFAEGLRKATGAPEVQAELRAE